MQKLRIRLNVKIATSPIYYDHAMYTHFCPLLYFLSASTECSFDNVDVFLSVYQTCADGICYNCANPVAYAKQFPLLDGLSRAGFLYIEPSTCRRWTRRMLSLTL